jgi:hypothetical protein
MSCTFLISWLPSRSFWVGRLRLRGKRRIPAAKDLSRGGAAQTYRIAKIMIRSRWLDDPEFLTSYRFDDLNSSKDHVVLSISQREGNISSMPTGSAIRNCSSAGSDSGVGVPAVISFSTTSAYCTMQMFARSQDMRV